MFKVALSTITLLNSLVIVNSIAPPKIIWQYPINGWKETGNGALDSDGNFYFPDDAGYLYKINKQGKLVWQKFFNCSWPAEKLNNNGIPISVEKCCLI